MWIAGAPHGALETGDDAAAEANAFGYPRSERKGKARTIMAARLGRMGRTLPGASVSVKISATVRLTVRTAVKICLARCAIVPHSDLSV